MKLRIVFMGTPEFAVPTLKMIHLEHTIVGVYTQPDRPVGRGLGVRASAVKETALELGLPIFQPEKLSAPGEFEKLQVLNPDVIVVVAYGQILKRNVLELPRLGCVNIHSSLLPRWRGAAPMQWAILEGDRETGITTMLLVEKLDAGPILIQSRTPLEETDTIETVHNRLAQMGAKTLLSTLEGLASKTIVPTMQDENQVTYAARLTKDMEWLDPSQSAEVLSRKIRALNPWPGTSVKVGQRLKIRQAKLHSDLKGPQGQIFERAGMVLLGTAKGSLELLKLQWEGKKEIEPSAFLNGLKGSGRSLPLDLNVE